VSRKARKLTICPACGAENRANRLYCRGCGAPLGAACNGCGATNDPGDRFCGGCGEPLDALVATDDTAPPPQTEVRVLSVLFVDLVGFTSLAESRDPEDIRALLERYFARARQIVARYGGSIEKFVGDAVMAVWGSPVAHDDDAERAVRAALDLVAEVAALGEEEGIAALRARAGVTTGRVAVATAVGAAQEAMVVGDRVNTAARLQTLAGPGQVLVDEATRRATRSAIAYDDAGEHPLKGKQDPVRAWRAMRVVARRGGRVRAQGLEPPFVGRERELRLVKDVFESVAREGAASAVAVVGQAGIGKSRLAWEFEKHLDGLVETVYWHRGRCLAYGEGVAYSALAEMVRGRADIADDEDPVTARRKLENALERHVDDPEERSYILPRLAHLLGLEERTAPDQADIFPAWRLLFERLAERHPVVMLVEDLQWADSGLFDFLAHLLDWAGERPIMVLALARPEISEREEWGHGLRSLTTIHLEPLSSTAMDELLAGLAPGLPAELRDRIAAQAQGVPLYAVETVRMLLDRGQIVPAGEGYELAGPVDELEVPETLQTLVSARLDGLDPMLRDLLQHAAVLGQSFSRDGLQALSGLDTETLDEAVRSLRAKDLVGIDRSIAGLDTDRYSFLQAIVRTVAYDTLSRDERKRRHLAAATHFRDSPGDELADVAASHFLDAYRADPEADDAESIRAGTIRMLRRSADRAESLAAVEEAQRCCDLVAELADEPAVRADALFRAGELARRAGDLDTAADRLREAAAAFAGLGDDQKQVLAEAALARVDFEEGHGPDAVARLEAAVARLDPTTTPVQYARLAAELARQLYFLGQLDEAYAHIDRALTAAEGERLLDVLCDALNTKALLLAHHKSHPEEAFALLRRAHILADHAPSYIAFRAWNNLLVFLSIRCQWDELREIAGAMLQRSRRSGDGLGEMMALRQLAVAELFTGRWDRAEVLLAEAESRSGGSRMTTGIIAYTHMMLLLRKGELDEARRIIDARVSAGFNDEQERLVVRLGQVELRHLSGQHRQAVDEALAVLESSGTMGFLAARVSYAIASALALGDLDTAVRLRTRAAELADPVDAMAGARLLLSDARIAAARGESQAEQLFTAAIARFEEAGLRVERAAAQVSFASYLLDHDRAQATDRLLEEAEAVLTEVGARLELERLAEVRRRRLVAQEA
jgi:class 3 adenylate cyclase/tetratricopeptide (TPR) repeat protein